MSLLVTGATGLVGSNACRLACDQGYDVRAFVRPGTDAGPLEALGVEVFRGDIADPDAVERAVEGVDLVVHAAAQIGGTWSMATAEDFRRVNQQGSLNVLAAAERAGVRRTAVLLSAAMIDPSQTLTESSPVVPLRADLSPYVRSKLAAYYEGMARAARGQEVVFVVPGGIYGPSVMVERALVPTIFNHTVLMAARRELTRYLPMTIGWVYAEDVAAVSLLALERGEPGRRYLAAGGADDAMSLPAFCNRALAIAGLDHRVEEIDPNAPGVDAEREFGSMAKLARHQAPEPFVDPARTTEELGRPPTPLDEGLDRTVAWLRAHGKL